MSKEHTFESEFFSYQKAVPYVTKYPKQYAKSNDLRLLIQIFTRSCLRMSTDSKTNNPHFTCKVKGPDCFDLQAVSTEDGKAYYLTQDLKNMKHKNKCEQEGSLFRYLQIYNLMKLKKNLIQQFMKVNQLMQQSPSVILTCLSQNKEVYFFQKYIGGQLELKRKLRKRFDNVVNIDIKKIGKPEEPQKEEICYTKQSKCEAKKMSTQKHKLKALQQKLQEQEPQESESRQIQLKSSHKNKKIAKKHAKLQLKRQKIDQRQKKDQYQQIFFEEQPSIEMKQYIFILGQGHQTHKEEVVNAKSSISLPALNVLNEQAIYKWDSSSDQHQSGLQREPFEILSINKEDYFKSLRNSTLKQSLQKESLTHLIFSKENALT